MSSEVERRLYILATMIVMIVALGSCGARKNTAPSRFYHSVNSRYNTYFNGKTTFDDALKAMNDGYQENYTERIVMFPVNGVYKEEKTSTGGPFNRAIEKGNKAIRLHSIKEKPPRKPGWQSDPKQIRLQLQEEFNPFMKYCWLMIAESHYYNGDFLTAAVTYSYIARHYITDPELVAEARIWQARCYSAMDWFYETNNIIKKLDEAGIPEKHQKSYDRMIADYLIRSEQTEKAIPYLQNAVTAQKNKRQRSRWQYLLGQLYQENEQNESAFLAFRKVASSNPPYELEFAARIRQTEVLPEGNDQKVLKMLRRMAKSDKNKDFLDQVYYAMGNVYMTLSDTAKAIDSYAQGIEKSTQNGMDKAICQIRLGDIYFTQKDYLNAQPCFSGALAGLPKEYKDYNRVSRLSETLDELVVYYEAVHLQDSLQTLARMPEAERLAVIDKIIEDIIAEEKKAEKEAQQAEYLATQEAMGSNMRRGQDFSMPTVARGDNSFYFYNAQTVAQGKTQFQNKWGRRTLEDNWRRRDKKIALLPTEEDMAQNVTNDSDLLSDDMLTPADSLAALQDSLASDPKSREYYLQQIPLTEDDLLSSDLIIQDGLYNMGMIYKDKLEDMPLSVETFEELERRFPDNPYHLDYYYQVYLMALRYKDEALAEKYKAKLIAEFPESDYAIAISDPDYEYNMRMMDIVQDSIYEQTYLAYLAEDTTTVRRNYREVSSKYPLAILMPKFMFLNALTYVQAGDAEGFKEALTLLTEKFPTADVSELANEMLKGLLRGRQLMQGSISSLTWNLRFGIGDDGELSATDSARTFSAGQAEPHRMLLIYATGIIDRNQLLYAVALYNFANFRVRGFDLRFEDVSPLTLFHISGFGHFNEIIDYYKLIYSAEGYASAIDDVVSFFPISDQNYDVLMHGKTLEEYMAFFIENYSEAAPELVSRWRVRVESDRKEEEAAQEKAKAEQAAKEQAEREAAEAAAAENRAKAEQAAEEKAKVEAQVEPVLSEELEKQPVEPKEETPQTELEKMVEALMKQSAEEEEHPAAKRDNIFRKLFRRVKESKEVQSIRQSFENAKELTGNIDLSVDTLQREGLQDSLNLQNQDDKPLERVDGELTYQQIQEIRKREAEEKALLESEQALSKEEEKKANEALKKQQAKEKEQLLKAKEKADKERQLQLKKERKEKDKLAKQKLKDRNKEIKAKEKARKDAQKAKAAQAKAAKKAADQNKKQQTKK